MKTIFGRNQFLIHSGSIICLGLAAVTLIFAGCGKSRGSSNESPAASPEQVKQAETDHMPVAARVSVTPGVITQPNGDPDMGELNRTLLRWVLKNRRRPNNYEDFAATAGVSIPPPPTGKKYFLASNMHIELISQ